MCTAFSHPPALLQLSHLLPMLQRCIDCSPRTHFSMSEWCVSPFHDHRSLLCILSHVWSDWLTTVSMKHSDLSLDTFRIAVQVCRAPSALLLQSCSLSSASCAVDSLGISLHSLMQCWRHIALVSGVGLSQVVWCQSFTSCSGLNCYLLGVSRGCLCAGYCVADSSQSVRSCMSWDAEERPVMKGQTAEAALLNMMCCWCGRFTE